MRFHGHMCPGQVLGVRMTLAGCREIGLEQSRSGGKGLVVLVVPPLLALVAAAVYLRAGWRPSEMVVEIHADASGLGGSRMPRRASPWPGAPG